MAYTVIIVDYNSIRDTINYISHCVDKFAEISETHFVVVDNMPNSPCKDILAEEFNIAPFITEYCNMQVFTFKYKETDVRILQVGQNVGYARGIMLEFCIRKMYGMIHIF